MTSNIPPHLQEKMDKQAEKQSERLTSSLVDADSRVRHFKAGYRQAYTDIMRELGPVVKALEKLSKSGDGSHVSRRASCFDSIDDLQTEFLERKSMSREALKHLKERILPEERTGGMTKMYSEIQGFSVIHKNEFNGEFSRKKSIQEEIKKIQDKMILEVQRGFAVILNPKTETIDILKLAGFQISEEEKDKVNIVEIRWDENGN